MVRVQIILRILTALLAGYAAAAVVSMAILFIPALFDSSPGDAKTLALLIPYAMLLGLPVLALIAAPVCFLLEWRNIRTPWIYEIAGAAVGLAASVWWASASNNALLLYGGSTVGGFAGGWVFQQVRKRQA